MRTLERSLELRGDMELGAAMEILGEVFGLGLREVEEMILARTEDDLLPIRGQADPSRRAPRRPSRSHPLP